MRLVDVPATPADATASGRALPSAPTGEPLPSDAGAAPATRVRRQAAPQATHARPPAAPKATRARRRDDQLRSIVEEAVRLIGADGGVLYLLEPDGTTLRLARDTGITGARGRRWARGLRLPVGRGMVGRAVAERRPQMTGDYAVDAAIAHSPAADRVVTEVGIRSMVVAPLVRDGAALGALGVFTNRPAAFTLEHASLVSALASHAAAAITNERLIGELAASRSELARRVESERTLREMVGRLAATRESDELLRQVVREAGRLVHADATILAMLGADGRLHWDLDDGLRDRFEPGFVADLTLEVGVGVTGRALAGQQVVTCNRGLVDAFPRSPESDHFFAVSGARSMIAAPIVGESGPLGALEVYANREDAFDETDAALIGAFADQAAVAIANARLIDDLARSRSELRRSVETERALREISGRMTSLGDPGLVLQQVVDETRHLLRSDGAHLTLLSDDGRALIPTVVTQGDANREWLQSLEFPLDGGLNGLAASRVEPVWSRDYMVDPRVPHEPQDQAVAERMGLRGVAVAPLRAPGRGVLGTLAISYRVPRDVSEEEVALLSSLADQAAIVAANVRLYDRVRASEHRYRGLVEASPDIVFTVDAEGTFTYVGETVERQLGWTPAELVGRHFSALFHETSLPMALDGWDELQRSPGAIVSRRFDLVHRDGRRLAHEIRSFGLASEGAFTGAQGAARDVSERERLERELRELEERYRHLVRTSPDVVWAVDADGRFTFLSDRLEPLTGFRPDEMLGRPFGELIEPSSVEVARRAWEDVRADPAGVYALALLLVRRAGDAIPVEAWVTGSVHEGRLAGAHGSIRDMRERERLERELRESEARYRYLVDNSPDAVWSADADGVFTYMSETSEGLLGWRPDDLVGRHFSTVVHPESRTFVESQYGGAIAGAASSDLQYRFVAMRRDGSRLPVEMHARTIVEDGRYLGAHGSVRDLRDRERLERDLRRQAAALAANEERAHLARELHDSVTQALFSMTLVTRSIELQLSSDPAAAAARIDTLRELQRDALAEMRALIFELRPASLEVEGLVQALRTHAAAVQGRTGLAVVIEADEMDRLPDDLEASLYRVAQEALHNVVKHAAARQVRITLERRASRVMLAVEDDGIGFDPGSVPEGHLGVAGMRARVEKLGGRLTITSAAGRGTRVEAALALDAPPLTDQGE